MEGADWFHWSGITPAISDKAAELTKLACEAAKRHGVTVSVDLNFRKKLWTKEKAQNIMIQKHIQDGKSGGRAVLLP